MEEKAGIFEQLSSMIDQLCHLKKQVKVLFDEDPEKYRQTFNEITKLSKSIRDFIQEKKVPQQLTPDEIRELQDKLDQNNIRDIVIR
ncbi:MAG: hypothetical protein NUV68_08640 [Caldiserica bacterium]|nr:hypothetical protein [Caldisericota bacterium]